jgi:hypothetical protein
MWSGLVKRGVTHTIGFAAHPHEKRTVRHRSWNLLLLLSTSSPRLTSISDSNARAAFDVPRRAFLRQMKSARIADVENRNAEVDHAQSNNKSKLLDLQNEGILRKGL